MMYMEQETYFNSDHICPSIIVLSLKRYTGWMQSSKVKQESWYVISRRMMDDYRDLTDGNVMHLSRTIIEGLCGPRGDDADCCHYC